MAQVIRSAQGSSATLTEERGDGSIVVEADTAEEGVRFARERLGGEAEILEVTRIERGGLRGFFARELFQVTAGPAENPSGGSPTPPAGVRPEVDALVRQISQVGGGAAAREPAAPSDPAPDQPTGLGHALGRVESEEEAFGSMLRRELHARGLAATPTPAIDLTDGSGASPGGPVPVGPAVARPLRPLGAPPPVPPVPVPPAEPFRIDGPPEPSAPLPVVNRPSGDRARSTLRDAVLVDAHAQVRPPTGASDAGTPPLRGVADPGSAQAVEQPSSVAGSSEEPAPESSVAGLSEEPAPDSSVAVAAERDGGATAEPVAPGLGSVRWSVDRLAHLGLPFALVQRTVGLDPADDQRWLLTLAAGLADFVRPEPAGSAVFAGPRADRIGAAMDLPVVEAPELPPYGGSVALKTIDDGAGRAWLGRVRGDRVLHVVVGGRGWELLLAKDPDAVVVSSADSVLPGLQVAVEHGVPISFVADGGGLRRANALDLAIAVRSLVGRW